jgi:hypothetical protein
MILSIAWGLAGLLFVIAVVRSFIEKVAQERNPNTDMIFFAAAAMCPLGAIVATIAALVA